MSQGYTEEGKKFVTHNILTHKEKDLLCFLLSLFHSLSLYFSFSLQIPRSMLSSILLLPQAFDSFSLVSFLSLFTRVKWDRIAPKNLPWCLVQRVECIRKDMSGLLTSVNLTRTSFALVTDISIFSFGHNQREEEGEREGESESSQLRQSVSYYDCQSTLLVVTLFSQSEFYSISLVMALATTFYFLCCLSCPFLLPDQPTRFFASSKLATESLF